MRRLILVVLTIALASLMLASCDLTPPPEQLVCTRNGKEVYRSPPVSFIYQREKADSWQVGDSVYMPEPGTTCRRR